MSYNDQLGFKTVRLTADGQVDADFAIRKVWTIGFLSGGVAGVVEWHDDDDALDAAKKRGGLTGVINSWYWPPMPLNQQLKQCYINIDANVTECVIIYAPAGY